MTTPSYWAVIPARVRYDEELRPNAKLLYAEITALMDKTGYCFATNQYFANLFKLGDRTVTDLIKQLKDKGYIEVEVINVKGRNERRITADRAVILDDHPAKNGDMHPAKNGGDHPAKNGGQNNINNISIPPISPNGGERVRSAPKHKPERFEKLWEFYPHDKRGNRSRAVKSWDKLKADDDLIDTIARALVVQLRSDEWSRGIGIPHLSTYLNNAYWEDAEDSESTVDSFGWADDPEVL